MNSNTGVDELTAYPTKELADIYGVCSKTFNRWISPFKSQLGKRRGRYYTVIQVSLIFGRIGIPSKINRTRPEFD